MTTNYQYIDSNGRNKGATTNDPGVAELSAKSALYGAAFVVGLEDQFDESSFKLGTNQVTNNTSESYNFQAEFYLLVNDSNGTNFQPNETVTQTISSGDNFTAKVAGFEVYNHNWDWDGLTTGTAGTGLLTIMDCGPTGGTGGPTGPTGGTGGTLGGPGGCGGSPKPIVGASSGAAWDVIGIAQRIPVFGALLEYSDQEKEDATKENFTPLFYNDTGGTVDLSTTTQNLGEIYQQIQTNHEVYAIGDSEYIRTVTIYDTDGTGIVVDAVSGGSGSGPTGPTGPNSEFTYLYHQFLSEGISNDNQEREIDDAYGLILSGTAGINDGNTFQTRLNSVHKIKTLYGIRNP